MFNLLSQVIDYYQEYHLTKNKYQYRADNLRFFDAYDLKDLRKKDVKQYAQLRRVHVSNATINRECSFARAAINRVNEDYELKINNPFPQPTHVPRPDPMPPSGGMAVPPMKIPSKEREYDYLDRK